MDFIIQVKSSTQRRSGKMAAISFVNLLVFEESKGRDLGENKQEGLNVIIHNLYL